MGTVYNPLHKSCPLFFLGFGVITAYIPGIVGASISTGWLFLLIVAPILFLYCDIKLGLGFIFICYAAISLIWTEILNIAWFHFLQLVVLGCVFHIGRSIKENDLKTIFKGLVAGLGISVIISILQWQGFNLGIYVLSKSYAGLFINPNIYSEISAILLISCIVLKLWYWIPITIPGLLFTQSRAAYLALIIGLLIAIWKYNKYIAISLVLLVGLFGLYFYWGKFSLISIQERLDMWADTIQGFKIFGNGVGSYEALFPYYSTHINTELARPRYAHNDLLQIIFEFGIGSILFLMVLINVFRSNKPETAILLTVCVISIFTYPLHIPTPAFIAFLVAGYLTSDTAYNWNFWNNRGSSLFKWAKTGEFIKT